MAQSSQAQPFFWASTNRVRGVSGANLDVGSLRNAVYTITFAFLDAMAGLERRKPGPRLSVLSKVARDWLVEN